MFLWMTPIPPSRATAIAICDSVTVSMAAESTGIGMEMRRLSRVPTTVSRG